MSDAFELHEDRTAFEPADPRQRRRFTFDDVMEMLRVGVIEPDDRVELIDGELIEMSPEKSQHMRFKNGLGRHLGRILPDRLAVYVDSTLNLSAYNAPEPDVYVFDAALNESRLRGEQVDLAIEVSDSSIRTDLVRKSQLYASFGMPEYWVVDINRRVVWVHRDPDAKEQIYRDVSEHSASDRITPLRLAGFDFALDDLKL